MLLVLEPPKTTPKETFKRLPFNLLYHCLRYAYGYYFEAIAKKIFLTNDRINVHLIKLK